MATDDALQSRVRAMLSHLPDVTEKRMFGSLGFMVRGKLCIGVRTDRIMCRIDPALHDEAIGREGCRTVVMKGREYRGYVYIDADALRSRQDLQRWVDLALNYNEVVASTEDEV